MAAEAKEFAFNEITAGALFDQASEIASGLSAETFTDEERQAAFAIRTAIADLDRGHPILACADPHELLSRAGDLVPQIREAQEQSPINEEDRSL